MLLESPSSSLFELQQALLTYFHQLHDVCSPPIYDLLHHNEELIWNRLALHESQIRHAIMMPAMSPFATTGGTIRKWNKKEGEAFVAGDVLLQIV